MRKAEFITHLDALRGMADKLPEDIELNYGCIDETCGIAHTRLRIGSGLRQFAEACGAAPVDIQPVMEQCLSFQVDGVEVFQYEKTV